MVAHLDAAIAAVQEMVAASTEAGAGDRAGVGQAIHRAIVLMGLIALGAVALAIGAALYIASRVTAPLRQLVGALEPGHRAIAGHTVTLNRSSDDLTSVAGDVSDNMHSASAASEQLGASIQEIASSAATAAAVAADAVERAHHADEVIAKLGESSTRIGEVINMITVVAEQTKLLALNATIESARAGEAGKGFAVVAHEVKALAAATSEATEDIEAQVATIQADVQDAIAAISEITRVVGQISDNESTIASAVEEQTATTSQIASSVTYSSNGAATTQRAAEDLGRLAEELNGLVGRFVTAG